MCMRREEGARLPHQTSLPWELFLCSLPWGAPRDLLSLPKVQVHQSGSSMAPGVEEKGSEDGEGQVRVREYPGPQVVETNVQAAPSAPGRVPSPGRSALASCSFQTSCPQGLQARRGEKRMGLKGPHGMGTGCPVMTGHLGGCPGVLAQPSSTTGPLLSLVLGWGAPNG